jgi:hypothetical protein
MHSRVKECSSTTPIDIIRLLTDWLLVDGSDRRSPWLFGAMAVS